MGLAQQRFAAADYHVLRVRADTIEIMLKSGLTVKQYAEDVLGTSYKTLERALRLQVMIQGGARAASAIAQTHFELLDEAADALARTARYKIQRGVTERRTLRRSTTGAPEKVRRSAFWGEEKVSLLDGCQERAAATPVDHDRRVVDVLHLCRLLEAPYLKSWFVPLTRSEAKRLLDAGEDASDADARHALAVYVDRMRADFLKRAPGALKAQRRRFTRYALYGCVSAQRTEAERDRLEWLLGFYRPPKRVDVTLRNLRADVKERSRRRLSPGESALLYELFRARFGTISLREQHDRFSAEVKARRKMRTVSVL